jgi:predicted DNA-binding protein (MmcQ/YjbR family)
MNVEKLRLYCLAKPATTEGFPFDGSTLVFKVAGKMYALMDIDKEDLSMNLKCDPERAILLRDEYSEVRPGWHMNKKHWNTVQMDGLLSEKMIYELIDHSYELVVASLSKAQKEKLNEES